MYLPRSVAVLGSTLDSMNFAASRAGIGLARQCMAAALSSGCVINEFVEVNMRRVSTRISLVLSLILVASALFGLQARADSGSESGLPADTLIGEWWTEGREGRVNFQRYRDGTYRGTTTCCKPLKPSADRPLTDHKNPNPALRERATVGIVIIWKLVFDSGEYSGGHVYNPRDGKTYRINVEVLDKNTIKIRGFLGISLLGQSQVWKRATAAEALDHTPR
jgi:uncharacterized protein (DUF2147 family)